MHNQRNKADPFDVMRAYLYMTLNTAAMTFTAIAPLVVATVLGGSMALVGAGIGLGWSLLSSFAHGMATTGDQRSWGKASRDFIAPVVIGAGIGTLIGSGMVLPAIACAVASGLTAAAGAGVAFVNEKVIAPKDVSADLPVMGLAVLAGFIPALVAPIYGFFKYKDEIRETPAVRSLYEQEWQGKKAFAPSMTKTFHASVNRADDAQVVASKPVATIGYKA